MGANPSGIKSLSQEPGEFRNRPWFFVARLPLLSVNTLSPLGGIAQKSQALYAASGLCGTGMYKCMSLLRNQGEYIISSMDAIYQVVIIHVEPYQVVIISVYSCDFITLYTLIFTYS